MKTEWISVKTALPNNMSEILIFFRGFYEQIKIGFFVANEFHSCAYNHDNITKWVNSLDAFTGATK